MYICCTQLHDFDTRTALFWECLMTNLIDTLKFFTSMFTVVQVCLRLVYGLPKGALRICLPKVEKGIIYIYIYIYSLLNM